MPDAKQVHRGGKSSGQINRRDSGFTLVELLVSVVILLILMGIIFQIIQMVSQAWKKSSQNTSTMQQARVAFERMTRNLSQATLNTYYSYYYASGATSPSYYMRQSELQFVSGTGPINGSSFLSTGAVGNTVQITHAVFFQAPLGVVALSNTSTFGNLNNLLNACGYFVTYGPDPLRPDFLKNMSNPPPTESRFRLMEYLQPSENLGIYTTGAVTSAGATVPTWISKSIPDLTIVPPTAPVTVRPLASNIVALIILPEQFTANISTTGEQKNISYITTQSSSYNYDSAYQATTLTGSNRQAVTANQLPPLVKVIMVAIDEPSAIRLAAARPSATFPELGQSTLFQDPAKLFTTGGVPGDLDKFQDILNASASGGNSSHINTVKLNYYIFQTDVIIRGSKWTSQ